MVPIACYLYFVLKYRSPSYMAGGFLALSGFYLLWIAWPRIGNRPLGPAALLLAGLALPALGSWQFLQVRDLGDMDHAAYSTALWNLRHGNLHYSLDGDNMFGIHSQYTSFLWIPLHWAAGELGLKLGQGLCLLAACLLLVGRFRDSRGPASWGALAVLLSPPVASQFFFGFHPEILAAPVLVLALWAYREEKLAAFLACTAFLAYTKEVLTLAVGGILLLALVERRSWRWVLLPGLLASLLMGVYWFLILPRFAPEGNHLSYFMPSSPVEIVRMWFRSQNLAYALHVFLPFLPLMLAMPRRYLLLPLPIMAFYAAFPDPLFVVMWPNYAHPLAFLCAAGLVLKPDLRLGKAGSAGSPGKPHTPASLDGRILLACAVTSLLSYPLWREVISVPAGNLARSREIDRLDERVPRESPVVVNGPMLARFAARRELSRWRFRKKPLAAYEYVVIDAVLPFWLSAPEERARCADSLSGDPAWTREYARDGLYLFRRNPATGGPTPATESLP